MMMEWMQSEFLMARLQPVFVSVDPTLYDWLC